MKLIPILCASALLPLAACDLSYAPPPPPAEWNLDTICFVPLERQEHEEMQQAFRDCASLDITELRSAPYRSFEEEKTLCVITQGPELSAILAELRAVPYWYRLERRRDVHIQATPGEQDVYLARRLMRFRDAAGSQLWCMVDTAPICCAGPDGKPLGLFDIVEKIRKP